MVQHPNKGKHSYKIHIVCSTNYVKNFVLYLRRIRKKTTENAAFRQHLAAWTHKAINCIFIIVIIKMIVVVITVVVVIISSSNKSSYNSNRQAIPHEWNHVRKN